ncbi:Origin recognition complex subunit 3 [Cryptotermes secundus]|uniref:Origin recognition complex subunit 3 n=3 Tax=Cryptotermes secundus TaxID=105785 RepID=A0A2J7QSE1_9NEOP|nr:origin recognition complex subunit 3 [Cryptotermes secundus]PNF31504.1 Origin recognition complex subunit 3 [Cryptotermes secundus]
MDHTVSVSKGCFVHKRQKRNKNTPKKQSSLTTNRQPWYNAYKSLWSSLEVKLESLQEEVFSQILENLVLYIQNCHINKSRNKIRNEIPSATLLTGVNLPDHEALFATLSSQLHDKVTPYVATLQARHCATVRSAIEHLVLQFMNYNKVQRDDDLEETVKDNIKKNQYNFLTLSAWYKEQLRSKSPKKKSKNKPALEMDKDAALVVIIPNVEGFSPHILQNFILIASGYINSLPLVFVFGVATAVCALHRSLPYHVSSKLCNEVFHSQPSTAYLNQVLEKVVLTSTCPFQLDDKTFKLLTDIFLFYDLSVYGFIQHYKYCMMEHFFNCDHNVLCCSISELSQNIKSLSKEQLEELRQLPSFRRYVDTLPKKEKAPLLLDDHHFKEVLEELMTELHGYLLNLHTYLRCLHTLTASLPKSPLGKQLREVYNMAICCDISESPQFRECFQLLGFQSREELLDKLGKVLGFLESASSNMSVKVSHLKDVQEELSKYYTSIANMGIEATEQPLKSPSKIDIGENINRYQLKEKLLELSRKQKPLSAYEETRKNLLDYLAGSVFPQFLVPPTNVPFNEVFFFNNVARVKRHIVGTPRAAIHMALNNPHYYLECKCCKLDKTSSIIPSMPDICIVYKLHLECGRLINMYDWLQAFLAIVNPSELGEEQRDVAPEIQARFTRAVAELQFLGFIKPSKRKTDHVTRLTWGAS